MILFLITHEDVCHRLTWASCLLLHFISPAAKNLKQELKVSLPPPLFRGGAALAAGQVPAPGIERAPQQQLETAVTTPDL